MEIDVSEFKSGESKFYRGVENFQGSLLDHEACLSFQFNRFCSLLSIYGLPLTTAPINFFGGVNVAGPCTGGWCYTSFD